MEFKDFSTAVQRQFVLMKEQPLFWMNIDKDKIWQIYLESFPEGSNPIYKTRTHHDCNCCKSFIRNAGGIVTIVNNQLVSIWDIQIGGHYQVVANALSNYVKSCSIDNIFLYDQKKIGQMVTYQNTEQGVLEWDHFAIQLDNKHIALTERKPRDQGPGYIAGRDIGSKLSQARSNHDVFLRGLKEITTSAIDTVVEIIQQGSLYRGSEHLSSVRKFAELKLEFLSLKDHNTQDRFVWSRLSSVHTSVSIIRNTVIGTLLTDISNGKPLDQVVGSFESKVAPTNYKRTTALVTQSMIEKAKQQLESLDLMASLDRRFAVLEDISINNILFADRTAKKHMQNVFDELSATAPIKKNSNQDLSKIDSVPIEDFINKILPNIDSMEVFFDNKHTSNLVSLIAPCDLTAKNLFVWPNPFSWSYKGEVTDSIKERVKRAGGNVTGDLRCSLSWFNHDDLDLRMVEPNKHVIYYGNKRSVSPNGGMLDVDQNFSSLTNTPVENIVYKNKNVMRSGVYELFVHQYTKRKMNDVGFEIEIECENTLYNFSYNKDVKYNECIRVATIEKINNEIKIHSNLQSTSSSRLEWNIPTQSFHRVQTFMLSPNFWNNQAIGNKHYFFILEGCKNDDSARGFFNEFLKTDLHEHRKVLEMVGSKMKVQPSDNQLSGLGFSSTNRNELLCKVSGNFTRIIKLIF